MFIVIIARYALFVDIIARLYVLYVFILYQKRSEKLVQNDLYLKNIVYQFKSLKLKIKAKFDNTKFDISLVSNLQTNSFLSFRLTPDTLIKVINFL